MSLPSEALQRFADSFGKAEDAGIAEPNAMTLATRGVDGGVSCRVVLLKDYDTSGFVFYTNTLSRKGRQLASDPAAALTFYWPQIEQQIRIEGQVAAVSDQEADQYFASRPRGSQLGAWASDQSNELASREALEARLAALEQRYAGAEIPRPPHWSGYRVAPRMIEFWYAGQYRLHDRLCFRLQDGKWRRQRLYP